MKKFILIPLVILVIWLIDSTPIAFPLEIVLARGMGNALTAVLHGLGLDTTLHCVIAPACSGIRIATACAIYGVIVSAKWWKGVFSGILVGLTLNLLRIFCIEMGYRFSNPLGETLHACALPLIIIPALLLGCTLWQRIPRRTRRVVVIGWAWLFSLLLISSCNAPAKEQSPAILYLLPASDLTPPITDDAVLQHVILQRMRQTQSAPRSLP